MVKKRVADKKSEKSVKITGFSNFFEKYLTLIMSKSFKIGIDLNLIL